MVEEGQPFPDFSLSDQDGNVVTKSSLAGHKAIIYFYPKDDTSGCTVEACEFRDVLPKVQGAKVFGVSPDDAKSHQKFMAKHKLNFPLLVDSDHALAERLGIWVEKSMYGKTYMGIERTTFLVDEQGIVRKIWRKVKPAGHAAEVLAALG
jgi:peroxiredoxin Q/BCP